MKMNTQNWFKKKINSIKDEFDFRLESLILDITERIAIRMKQKGISRIKLAKSLNVSPPAVTKVLNGTSNFTLKTLLSLADALDFSLKVEFEEKQKVESVEFYKAESPESLTAEDVGRAYRLLYPDKAYSSIKRSTETPSANSSVPHFDLGERQAA
jgi:transcriptional regulator with XRE-family HTH domain